MNRSKFLECITNSIVDAAPVKVEGNWTLHAELVGNTYVTKMFCNGFEGEVFTAVSLDELCYVVSRWYDKDEALTLSQPVHNVAQAISTTL